MGCLPSQGLCHQRSLTTAVRLNDGLIVFPLSHIQENDMVGNNNYVIALYEASSPITFQFFSPGFHLLTQKCIITIKIYRRFNLLRQTDFRP